MTGVDSRVVVGYVVLMAAVKLLVKRYRSDISDYFRAGCTLIYKEREGAQ